MSKKSTKALASATLMSLVLTTALSGGSVKAAAGKVTRAGGDTRYATAATLATQSWTTSDNVVLVSGEGYADAVSATALAKKLDAPILLTHAGSLDTETATALSKLKAKTVYIVGGTGAVSQSVRDSLKANSYSLIELSGANRYDTNAAVAKELVSLGVDAKDVMMVGGENFPDALSVAPVAAAKGQILLLGMSDASHMQSVLDFVKDKGSNVTVVGTKNMISDDILSTVKGTRVDGGATRFETNINVLNKYNDSLKNDKMYIATATGDNYPDALVAAAAAGKANAPLVLVDGDGTTGTSNALDYIKTKATKTTDLNVVGGTGVVSSDLETKINNTVNPDNPDNSDVSIGSIEATDLNQIKVTFNADVDEDSAENVGNYKLDGTTLTNDFTKDNAAVANLLDDNRTVLITLKTPKEQQKEYTFDVKNSVLSADKTKSITEKSQTITFADTSAPTVSSVTAKGNSKLTVKFSEPVKMPVTAVTDSNGDVTYQPRTDLTGKFKINNQNITSFGLDPSRSKVKNAVVTPSNATTGSTIVWADEVDFYFSSKLPTGSNKLEVSDGNTDSTPTLCDASGYILKEDDSQTFTVDANSTKPTVKEVKADADGTMWVRFDRPMDEYTATKPTNYGLNTSNSTTGSMSSNVGALKENDCTIKFKGESFNTGANTLYVDTSVKDAFGNAIDDDTNVSFTNAKDSTKPTVSNVNMIDSETIRMTFSKDVDANYATKLANYTLKDASGVDISDHMRVVKQANKSVSDSTTAGNITVQANDNVWDIKMFKNEGDYQQYALGNTPTTSEKNNDWRLTSSKYTLTIKNLIDTTSNKNVMDDYPATLNGTDDIAPKMNTNAYKKANSSHKVVVVYSEAMDGSNLTSLSSYQYKNNSGDSKNLPSDTKITAGNDSKTVTLEFPSNYYIKGASDIPSGIDDDNVVTGILATGVKDLAGNAIDSFNNVAQVSTTSAGTFAYKNNTYRMENDGDDLLVKVQFSNAIDPDTAVPGNFTVAGQTPDSVNIDGSDVVLRFNKDNKTSTLTTVKAAYETIASNKAFSLNGATKGTNQIDKRDVIKLYGASAQLVVSTAVTDMTGAAPTTAYTVPQNVYDYTAAPKTTSDYWYATANAGVQVTPTDGSASTTAGAVVLTFDTALDASSCGVKTDDFKFNIGGTEIKADAVKVSGNSLVFLFGRSADKTALAGSSVKVAVTLKSGSNIDVEAKKDANGNNAKYVPSDDDKNKTRTIDTVTILDLSSMIGLH